MNLLPLLCLIPSVIGQMFSVNASKNGSSGVFTSPGYPGNYPNNVHYTWTLTTGDSNATVVINITDFSVVKYDGTPKCEDYLQIEKIEPKYQLIIKRCGDIGPFNLKHNGNIFVVTFVSDSIHNARGFYLSWKVYIRHTTTTKPTTTTKEITIKTTEERTTTTSETIKTTTPRTTNSLNQIIKTTRGIHALSSVFLTLNQKQPMTHTNGLFTRDTDAYVANNKAHSTTEKRGTMLTKTDSMKKTTILITTQQITEQNNGIEPLGTNEIIYLVAGIGVVELTLVALGIYVVKQRRANKRHLNAGKSDKEKNRPVSRKSVTSVGNIYESIPMEHFSIKDAIPEEDESVYIEVPEHMYDKTFEHRPRVNVNANLYQLISELKTKNR